MAYLQVMYTYVTTSQVVHAPATSVIIKLLSKAARIGKLNAATFVVRPEAVAVITDRHAIEYPRSACDSFSTSDKNHIHPICLREAGMLHPAQKGQFSCLTGNLKTRTGTCMQRHLIGSHVIYAL